MVTFANLFSTAFAGIFWIFLASILAVENYGSIYFDMAIPSILGAISLVGLPTTVIMLTAKGNNTFKFQANLLVLITSICFSIPLFFIHWTLGAFLITNNFFQMATSQILGEKSYKEYSILIIGSRITQITFSLLFYEWIGQHGILVGYVLGFILFSYRYFLNIKFKKLELSQIKQHWHYISHVFGIQVSGAMYSFSDKVLIGFLYGFSNLGLYTLGSQFLNALGFLPSGLSAYLLPEESSGSNTKKIRRLGLILSAIFTVIAFFSIPFVVNTFLPEYVESIPLAVVMVLSLFPITVISIFNSQLLGNGKSKPPLIGMIIYVILQLIGIVIFGELFGILGLAISIVVANSIQAIYLWTAIRSLR